MVLCNLFKGLIKIEDLLKIRDEIDEIDRELLPLFLKRMNCSSRVAKVKTQQGLPILNAGRENEILEAIGMRAGENSSLAKALYKCIMEISRESQWDLMDANQQLQKTLESAKAQIPERATIACQGVEGAYSHSAAKAIMPKATVKFMPSFSDVFKAIQVGDSDFGLVPVENSAAGSVAEVYSLILEHRYFIAKTVNLAVSHCLAGKGAVTKVFSHRQALAQCSEFLKKYEVEEFSNTAAAAKFVAESTKAGLGAVCSEEAALKYGLTIIARDIQDQKNNCTRFALISKEPYIEENAEKISLCFSLNNAPGALSSVLNGFATRGLNLTKIESRPIKGRSFEYDFYLDFAGNIRQKGVLQMLSRLSGELPRFNFLGNYTLYTTENGV